MSEMCCGRSRTEFRQGDRVHQTRTFQHTRVGSAERYVIAYISTLNVIVRCFRIKDNTFICESHYTRKSFDEQFELCPGV